MFVAASILKMGGIDNMVIYGGGIFFGVIVIFGSNHLTESITV
jgi:hypothetical protein